MSVFFSPPPPLPNFHASYSLYAFLFLFAFSFSSGFLFPLSLTYMPTFFFPSATILFSSVPRLTWCRRRSIGTQVLTFRHSEAAPVFEGGQRYALQKLGIHPCDPIAEVEEIMTKEKSDKSNVVMIFFFHLVLISKLCLVPFSNQKIPYFNYV